MCRGLSRFSSVFFSAGRSFQSALQMFLRVRFFRGPCFGRRPRHPCFPSPSGSGAGGGGALVHNVVNFFSAFCSSGHRPFFRPFPAFSRRSAGQDAGRMRTGRRQDAGRMRAGRRQEEGRNPPFGCFLHQVLIAPAIIFLSIIFLSFPPRSYCYMFTYVYTGAIRVPNAGLREKSRNCRGSEAARAARFGSLVPRPPAGAAKMAGTHPLHPSNAPGLPRG